MRTHRSYRRILIGYILIIASLVNAVTLTAHDGRGLLSVVGAIVGVALVASERQRA